MFQRVVQGNSNLLTWFILSLLLMYSHLEDVQKCDRKRPIFTESWGIINDGPTNYTNNSHCEWLIKANSTTRFVTLKFKMLATECSYDHIFVYDGDSYSSPLLGTFSGDTLPVPVTAQSGSMLILLYSDTNYVLKGFEAEYSITDCPLNCSGKGTCVENHCECNHLASGDACEIELCHNACGANQRKGQCQHIPSPSKCVCSHGYSGQSCSLPATSNNSENYWHLLSQEGTGLSPRAGHGGVYLDSLDRIYIFGGFSFHQVLGDFLAFDFNQSKWLNMTQKENIPAPRWGHAMAAYANNIVIFGGELQDGKLSNELWLYDTNKQEWKLGATGSKLQPPSLTKHSLTVVDEKWLYVFGGSYQDGSFSSDMYRINLKPGGYWEKVEALGGKSLTRRLVGHSAIYYAPLKSLVVYGGISVRDARFSQFNIRVDAFHVEKKYWTELFPGRSHYHPQMMHVPLGRAFHTSSVIGNYMVVYGGYIHVHTKEEKCFDDALYFYHLECHKWVDMSKFMEENSGTSNPVPKGVFSHVASVRKGHTLVVVGGYNGRMRGDILAYVFPPPITSKGGESSRICSSYRSKKNCTQNSLCGWCFKKNGSEQGQCLEKSHSEECEFPCPGLCYQLQDCQSCLAWGGDFGTETVDLNIKYQPACGWCVQSSQCHPAKSPPPECQHTLNEAGGDVSWWGSQGTDIKSLSNCQIKDYPPGITLLSYHLHPDWNNPDNVSLLDKTTHSEWISRRPLTNHSIPNNEKVETIKLRGYIYPLNKNAKRGLFLTASPHLAVLRMSTDTTWEHMEIVANVTTRETEVKVQRPNGQTLFPNFTRYQKYLLELEARHHIDNTHQSPPKVELSWSSSGSENKVITREYLEPYRNGSCGSLSTCMSCLSDAECGWCHSQNQCLNRNKRDSHRSQCFHNEELQFLVLKTEDCPLCSDFINCKDCTQQPHCEWIVKTATCVRSGSNDKSVRHTKLCPIPCGSRLNCTSCLGNPGMCAWCEQTQTCFMFSTFTTSFMYGGCREWVDEDENRRGLDNTGGQCRNCSYHTSCRSCLNYLRCGWCGLVSNPTVGACVSGDYGGPDIGQCENIVKHIHTNISELELAEWSYSTCPLVDECRLGLHDCHLNASCVDTKDSYNCTCNKGFRGDGVSFCNRTCLEECVHGHCSEVLDYQCTCEIGWTGSDCNTNCGCNNHSTCVHGVGLCDECRDLTEGKFCEKCSPGSYGNATSMLTGCKKCDCNEHGDVEKGICDNKTGTCYCVDNTIGKRCEKCAPGYYGNPISGGQCYRRCNPRSVSTEVKRGGLGVPLSTKELGHCLWIFTVYSSLNESSFQENRQGAGILLTIESDIQISCYQNHIYVYDGLPKFLHPNRLRRELGTFCGKKQHQSIKVLATSGYLTVFYQHIDASQGFNATYHRVECPEFCRDPQRTCIDGRCQCKPGFVGPDCEEAICPNNCSSTRGYGACDETYGRCQCWGNYGRTNCSILLEPPYASWSVLFNPATARASSVPDLASVLPRMGHSLLTSRNPSLSNKGLIWVFGGYSTDKGELNDLYKFNTATSRWKEVVPEPQSAGPPPGRHFHGAAMTGNDIYVFGGLSKDRVLGDFWKFDTEKGVWTQLRTSSDVPPLSGLTLIAISDKSLLVIGGYSPEYGYLEYLLEYSLSSREWKILNSSGALPVGIYGHSSVYHSQTEAVYVFGGFLCDFNQVVVSDQLYAFHTPTLRWSRLPIDRRTSSARPMPRYFHAAATTASYMIIIGGRTNNSELINDVFAYNYKCNSWGTLQLNSDLPDIKRGERIFIDVKIEGERPGPLSGLAAVWLESGFYVFGGYNGQTQGHLYQLSLPLDLCHLFTSSALACRKHTGCSYCLTYENGTNETFCFAEEGSILSSCSKLKNSEHNRGFVCSNDWLEQRNCSQYTNCTDCVAFWPAHYGIKQACHWCSNCPTGRCIPASASCEQENPCNLSQQVVTDPTACPFRQCLASDCDKCRNQNNCMWTRHVQRSDEKFHKVNENPIFNWTCVKKKLHDVTSYKMESIPPRSCPPRCNHHRNCTTCLNKSGSEGGWHECRWSTALRKCFSPSFQRLQCEGGLCGSVLEAPNFQCSDPCWNHTQASQCLRYPRCGWCSFTGTLVDGQGLCMDGDLQGPTGGGMCRQDEIRLHDAEISEQVNRWFSMSLNPPKWAYLKPPPENECLNGHHTCDERLEKCVDLEEGFTCQCRDGYTEEGGQCMAVCNQGCVYGICVEPNVCKCHFGYVGQNCSTKCQCNDHSNCAGVDRLDECLECHNNTQGSQCEKCKPFFVGDPVKKIKCTPCIEYCNGHTDICFDSALLNNTFPTMQPMDIIDIKDLVLEGSIGGAVCFNCQNNTKGEHCQKCIQGYFILGDSIKDGCRPCECHGHGDTCDPLTGENCNCQNNTENERHCSQKNGKNSATPCWKSQCAKCKEYFLGQPTDGHQCYRHMYMDRDYCFDPFTQDDCKNPSSLLRGQTVFFAVQPRFMNVNIRVFVDVTIGGVDVYLSSNRESFVVEVNKTTGVHIVYVDKKFEIIMESSERETDFFWAERTFRPERLTLQDKLLGKHSNQTEPPPTERLKLNELWARGLTTYAFLKDPSDFLVIRGLQNRLVMTIPQEVHNLGKDRFYMILHGVGSESSSDTFGSLFFKQEQTKIDLFVFFSVFFSCFFLFLAICVIVWKVKQAFDLRRARRLHAAEMKHMASRPFASVYAIIEPEPEEYEYLPYSPKHYSKKTKYNKYHNGRDSPKVVVHERYYVRPVAIEPTDDGAAAIATTLILLPGGTSAPVRLALGSGLVTMRGIYQCVNIRSAMRRSTSHVTL